jgi:hypothetical protein
VARRAGAGTTHFERFRLLSDAPPAPVKQENEDERGLEDISSSNSDMDDNSDSDMDDKDDGKDDDEDPKYKDLDAAGKVGSKLI